MNSVSNTAELYEILQKLGIPVLNTHENEQTHELEITLPEIPDGAELAEFCRAISDIINDLFEKYRQAKNAKATRRQEMSYNALEFLFDNEVEFTEEQLLKFNSARSDRMRRLREDFYAKESDRALDEFLNGFKIIGGDEP